MKKVIRLTESDLNRMIKRIINEMDEPKKLSIDDWDNIWYKLRRQNKRFAKPDFDGVYVFGNIDFIYQDGGEFLEISDFFRDPSIWANDYDKSIRTFEKIIKDLKDDLEESGLGLEFKSGPNYRYRIYKN